MSVGKNKISLARRCPNCDQVLGTHDDCSFCGWPNRDKLLRGMPRVKGIGPIYEEPEHEIRERELKQQLTAAREERDKLLIEVAELRSQNMNLKKSVEEWKKTARFGKEMMDWWKSYAEETARQVRVIHDKSCIAKQNDNIDEALAREQDQALSEINKITINIRDKYHKTVKKSHE